MPGNSTALETFETIFNQDLNGDGTIGPPPTSTANDHPDRRHDHPAFRPATTTSSTSPAATPGPELKQGGAAVTAGSLAAGPDRRGAGGRRRLRHRLEETGADLHGVEPRQQRQLHLQSRRRHRAGNSTALETFETTSIRTSTATAPSALRHLRRQRSSRPTARPPCVEPATTTSSTPPAAAPGPELHYGGSV